MSDEDLLEFLYVCPVGLAQLASDGSVEMANPAYAQLMNQLDPSGGSVNFIELIARYAPEFPAMVRDFTAQSGVICQHHRVSFGVVTTSPFPLVASLTMNRLARGSIVVAMHDISSAAADQRAAKESDQRFRSLVDGVRDYAIFTLDEKGKVSTWNLSAEKLFGMGADRAMGRDLASLMPREDVAGDRSRALQLSARTTGWSEDEGWWVREATTRFWGSANISAVENGGFTVILRDLSRRKRGEDELRAMANADALTGLATRRYLAECGEKELFLARRAGVPLSVLMLDADHFKQVNEQHGHAGGDQVLRAIARICRDQTRDVDLVARYGGEEIVVVLPDTDIIGARNVAERIRLTLEAYREPSASGVLRVTASIGVACSSPADADLDALIARADAALYEAKSRGRNRVALSRPPTSEPQLAVA